MRDVYSSLNHWSCALVGIHIYTSKSCPAFPNIAVGLSTASYWYFARHRCWHRNFQLSSSGFDYEFELCIVWFDEVQSSELSGIIEFWFLDGPSLFFFLFGASDIRVHISGHMSSGREVFGFLGSLSPDHVFPTGGLSFKKMNLVEPVHASDNFFSIHDLAAETLPQPNACKVVCAVACV